MPKKKKSKSAADQPPEIEEQLTGLEFPVVGIGASAGGLEAFENFFSKMSPKSGMAFVLVQHLSAQHKSILVDLVQHQTDMQVFQVTDQIKLQPNSVYIIPPNKDMALLHGNLHLMEPDKPRGLRLPIDFFFRSLAQDQQERAICIVLSGTGTDGTLGLKEIKGAGGMVMVQEPTSAAYNGMPHSAIQTNMVDYILSPEMMGEALLAYAAHAFGSEDKPAPSPISENSNPLQKVFILLRAQTGHDFSYYKHNTIHRRIERRMSINQIGSLKDYIHYLQKNHLEVETLFRELLIGVTRFFRDPEAFEVLEKEVIPKIFAENSTEKPIRIWIPGCSTGEEAYSLAILCREHMNTLKQNFQVQIFATDIDSHAIKKARTGISPEGIVADISDERLERFFKKENGAYHINKEIRDMVVFAEQNISGDPPFSKVDLISCRNLLIYLQTPLQKKILPLFHYSLKDDGILFLGNSESIGEFKDLFTTVNRKWKIYQKKSVLAGKLPIFDFSRIGFLKGIDQKELAAPSINNNQINLHDLVEKTLLESYTPTCIIVNEKGEILYTHGRTGKYLETTTGEASLNILKMAREGLRMPLTAGLRKCISTNMEVVHQNLKVKTNGDYQTINLTINPIRKPATMQGLNMVLIEDVFTEKNPNFVEKNPNEPIEDKDQLITILEEELRNKEEYLQSTTEELQTSNEELKSTNEELQSSNEELQSTNEEMETSKEELQSINEELITVNNEHQLKIEELSQIHNDMTNLLASTEIGTVFLDQHLCVKRFTPVITNIINLIQTDIGRPLGDIAPKFRKYVDLTLDTKSVLDTLIPIEKEVESEDGQFFLMRIIPYRTVKNMIDGVVITFVDITERVQAKHALKVIDGYFQTAVSQSGMIFAQTDRDLRYTWLYNPHPDFKPEFALGKTDTEMADNEGAQQLVKLKEEVIKTGKNLEKEIEFSLSDKIHIYRVMAEPLQDSSGEITGVTTYSLNITARQGAKEKGK